MKNGLYSIHVTLQDGRSGKGSGVVMFRDGKILGGEIIRGPGRIDVKLGGANVFIAPVTAGDGVHTPPVTPYQGLDHFGLTVKDIDAVAAEIKAKGVEFTKEPTTIRPGVRICFIRGPQGISIELLERDKKYA